MIHRKTTLISRQLEALWASGTLTGVSDAQLLGRFASVRDATAETAFRELLHRHGPMVMGVCRQLLRHPQDADDAFQATFLVLVRKASTIRVGESLAPWFYAVAFATAHACAGRRLAISLRPGREPGGSHGTFCQRWVPARLAALVARRAESSSEQVPRADRALSPRRQDSPGGCALLHWPVGTVSGRLSRGRELLRARLKRRGMDVSPTVLAANWLASTPTSVALPLIESTVGAAIGFAAPAVSSSVLSLTQGVLKSMLFNKIKMAALTALLVGGMTAGVGVWGIQASRATTRPPQAGDQGPPEEPIKSCSFRIAPFLYRRTIQKAQDTLPRAPDPAGMGVFAESLEELAEPRLPKEVYPRSEPNLRCSWNLRIAPPGRQ